MGVFGFKESISSNNHLINDFFFSVLKKKLLDTEFSISQNGNMIKFQRNLIARNEVSDKLGLYRRVQVRGNIELIRTNEPKIQIEINTFYYFQFFAIILGIGIPLSLIAIFNIGHLVFLVFVYLVICFFYYFISVKSGNSTVKGIIIDSLKESYLQNKGVSRNK